jgi:hypothetical protein
MRDPLTHLRTVAVFNWRSLVVLVGIRGSMQSPVPAGVIERAQSGTTYPPTVPVSHMADILAGK